MLIGPCLLLTVNEWWIWLLHCQQKLPSEIRHNQVSVWEKASSKSSAKKYRVFKSSSIDLTSSHSQLINILHISKQSTAQSYTFHLRSESDMIKVVCIDGQETLLLHDISNSSAGVFSFVVFEEKKQVLFHLCMYNRKRPYLWLPCQLFQNSIKGHSKLFE
jgi:hypothetical protein